LYGSPEEQLAPRRVARFLEDLGRRTLTRVFAVGQNIERSAANEAHAPQQDVRIVPGLFVETVPGEPLRKAARNGWPCGGRPEPRP